MATKKNRLKSKKKKKKKRNFQRHTAVDVMYQNNLFCVLTKYARIVLMQLLLKWTKPNLFCQYLLHSPAAVTFFICLL